MHRTPPSIHPAMPRGSRGRIALAAIILSLGAVSVGTLTACGSEAIDEATSADPRYGSADAAAHALTPRADLPTAQTRYGSADAAAHRLNPSLPAPQLADYGSADAASRALTPSLPALVYGSADAAAHALTAVIEPGDYRSADALAHSLGG